MMRSKQSVIIPNFLSYQEKMDFLVNIQKISSSRNQHLIDVRNLTLKITSVIGFLIVVVGILTLV